MPKSRPVKLMPSRYRALGLAMFFVATSAAAVVLSSGPGESTARIRSVESPRRTHAGPAFEARFVSNDRPVFRLAAASHGSKVDPIEANGPIFVDWPKPDVALVFTGEQYGFLEPCGCAGLENQKGGFKRRFTLLSQLREKGWPLVPMDGGGLVRRYGTQAQVKLQRSLEGLVAMKYEAVGFGGKDLRLDMLGEAANLSPNPLVSANVGILDFDSELTRRFKVVQAGGYRIGITTVLGKEDAAKAGKSDTLVTLPPTEALKQVVPQLEAENCDELVLLAYADTKETKQLAAEFPQFQWVVSAKGGNEPPSTATTLVEGKQHLVEVGHKGMYAVVVGLYQQGEPRFRYQKVPLDHRFQDAPEMQQLMVDYQKQLEAYGLEELTLRPVDPPQGGAFAGSETCADCHSSACEVWENSPHAHATKTLLELTPPRHHDPECLSCHVTGWNPQGYTPYATGFKNMAETPHLVGNGCENCHGPAKRHVDAENGEIDVSDAEAEELRAALRLKIVPNEGNKGEDQVEGKVLKNCMACHDVDNSPDFDFQEYWNREEKPVKHYGKD